MNVAGVKAVVSISSHVMRGAVGNRIITPAIAAFGMRVWDVPTVVLPWHPGHGPSTRLTFEDGSFSAALEDLRQAKQRGEITAVLTGYFASAEQVFAAGRLIEALKAENPDLIYLCDPVIGDKGGLYVAGAIAEAIHDRLLPLASIATPNRFELRWLSDMATEDNGQIAAAVASLALPEAVVTSAHGMLDHAIANIHIARNSATLAEHRELSGVPNGLGDLLSALFLARRLAGESGSEALVPAAASVFQAALRAVERGEDELTVESEPSIFRAPVARVESRKLLLGRR